MNKDSLSILGNNANQLADMMLNDGRLVNGLSTDQCGVIAKQFYATTPQQQRWLEQDGFWEDFCYRAEELGIQLHL